MPEKAYDIRICVSCGLRYPLVTGQQFGTRCPACMGETRLILRRELSTEPRRTLPPGKAMAVLLDNVRSAWNAGSILRSADGFGFSQAYLCGITLTPEQEALFKTWVIAGNSEFQQSAH